MLHLKYVRLKLQAHIQRGDNTEVQIKMIQKKKPTIKRRI